MLFHRKGITTSGIKKVDFYQHFKYTKITRVIFNGVVVFDDEQFTIKQDLIFHTIPSTKYTNVEGSDAWEPSQGLTFQVIPSTKYTNVEGIFILNIDKDLTFHAIPKEYNVL